MIGYARIVVAATLALILAGCSSAGLESPTAESTVRTGPTATQSDVPDPLSTSTSSPTAEPAVPPVPTLPTFSEVEGWSERTDGITWAAPNGIAIDPEGNIYTTEFRGNRVRKLDADGRLILEWGGTGTANGQFAAPTGIAIGPSGNIYVSESGNHRVQKFTPDGSWIATFG